jgi:hypothetical protein
MARHQLFLPQADAACGKIFFADRRAADGHRIAMEVWNRATGRGREGYRLAVYRCKRCAGFHVGQRPIDRIRIRTVSLPVYYGEEYALDDWSCDAELERSAHLPETAWS